MPVGIDTETERLGGFGVVGNERTVVVSQQGGTMGATNMQAHIGRIAPIEAVAVDAPLELRILNQRTLVERGKVTLVDTHLAPYLVARGDETVADAVVDAIRTHVDGERTIGVPTISIFG